MMNLHEQRFKEIISRNEIYGIEPNYFNLNDQSGAPLPAWIEQETLYEIFIRNFSPEGTFESARKRLPEIKSLGIRIIWLMPIYPIGKQKRKGLLGSPYAIADYYQINPEYGDESDFRNFVHEVHHLDMKMIIDMVPNHVAPDYNKIKQQPAIIARDSKGAPTRKINEWTDVVDLDYGKEETWRHTLDIMSYWIQKFDIDGYRCDVAGMLPTEFWDWAVPKLRSVKQHIYLLAEWESPLLHLQAFNSTYDWSLYSLMVEVFYGKAPASILAEWIQIKADLYPPQSRFLRFVENHDKIRAMSLFQGQALIPFLVFIFSIDGVPLLYNGQEIGSSHTISLFENDPLDWSARNESLYLTYKKLISLRKEFPELSSKKYRFFEPKKKNEVLIFEKLSQQPLLVVINFSNKKIRLDEMQNLLTPVKEEKILFNSHDQYENFKLFPYQAVIVKI